MEKESFMKLSVIVPSIRTKNLNDLYNSINDACTFAINPWEMIVISPYDLPEYLKNMDNVKIINSFRSPIACQQQGLMEARGEYISWAADDGKYMPDSLNQSFKLLEGKDYTYLVMGKYFEGDNPQKMDTNWYYVLSNHDSMKGLANLPDDSLMLNCGVVSHQLLLELGGWDAFRFQVCPMAYNDFAVRARKFGAKFIIQDDIMFKCSHMPGLTGDHAPIHIAQIKCDEPTFRALYNIPHERIKIPLDNWKETDEVWKGRFGI